MLQCPDAPVTAPRQADKEDEIFDVVDEGNNIIGQQLRRIVHRDGILHRAVYCFVFNPAGQLLIQRRSPK